MDRIETYANPSDMTYLIIPTYNERENIQELLFKILELNIIDHILIVDDNSLDGTAEVVREVARQHPSITLLPAQGVRARISWNRRVSLCA